MGSLLVDGPSPRFSRSSAMSLITFIAHRPSTHRSCVRCAERGLGWRCGSRAADGISGTLINVDDGRPRAVGNVNECGNHHAFEHHSPLAKAPLSANPVVKRKQLFPNISEPLRERGLLTYTAVSLEICNMPLDALEDFLEQLTFSYWTGRTLVILSGELSNAVIGHETIHFGFQPPSRTCIVFALPPPECISVLLTSVLEGYPGS
jgi:hypothetical protein